MVPLLRVVIAKASPFASIVDMTLLPFVCHVPDSDFADVHAWCCQQWPHTKGETWHYSYLGFRQIAASRDHHRLPGAVGSGTGTVVDQFAFQFAADHMLFVLTWNDMLVQLTE